MNKNPNTHKNIKQYMKTAKKNTKQNSTSYISTNFIKNSTNYKISSEYPIKTLNTYNTIENGPYSDKHTSQIKIPAKISSLKGNSLNVLKNQLKTNQSVNSLNPKKSFNCCNIINNYYMTEVKKNECLTVRKISEKKKYTREKKIIKEFRKQYGQTSENNIRKPFKTNKDSIKIRNYKLSNYTGRDLINNALISNYMNNTCINNNMKIISNKANLTKKINRNKNNKIQNNKENFYSSNKYLTKENIFNNTETVISTISRKENTDFNTLNNKISLESNKANHASYKRIFSNKHNNNTNYSNSNYPLSKANSSNHLQAENPNKNLKLYSNIISEIPINLNLDARKTKSPEIQNFNLSKIPKNNSKFKRNKKVFDNINLLLDDNLYVVNYNSKNNKITARQSFTNYENYSATLVKTGTSFLSKQQSGYDNNINTERKIENTSKKLPINFSKNLSPTLNLKRKNFNSNKEKLNKILISDHKIISKTNKYYNKQFNTSTNRDNVKYSLDKLNMNNITNCIKELAILCANQEKIINDLSEDNRELNKKLCLQSLKK